MFKKSYKKSQAALEFLTTYAWAFLVIIIMMGALTYFGILKPSKIFPDRCNFGTEVHCVDYRIDATANTFNLRLKNSIGEPIIVDSITISSESATAYACSSAPTVTDWGSDETKDLAWSSCNSAATGFKKGDKGKVLVTMTYHLAKSSATYKHEVAGEVFSTIT